MSRFHFYLVLVTKCGGLQKMKKILILCSILLLVGCSSKEKNDNEYKGKHGTYEIIDIIAVKSAMLREDYVQFQWRVKYTNTTDAPIKPYESIKLDMVIENENDVELNDIPFSDQMYSPGNSQPTEEEDKLIKNSRLNIKPGATVEIMVGSIPVAEDNIDPIFLRNKNEKGQNGNRFEIGYKKGKTN